MDRIRLARYDPRGAGDTLSMPILNGLAAALAWLGRQGTRALAASIFLGLAVPPLAAYVKPYLGESVFVLLLFSYLRTDPTAFSRHLRSPGLTISISVWVMVAITPITSSAAFAALIGLDVALSLAALIVCNALSPLTSVAFSYLFLGSSAFSPLELGIKLFLFFGSAGALAFAIRWIAGQSWIERQSEHIDGLNVLAVFLFAIAAMDGVPRQVAADPLFAVELVAFIVVLTCAQIGLSMLVFWRAGFDRGLVIGLLSGFRNIGLVMATLGASLPDLAWFYFAMAQVPIYLMPAILRPLARRLAKKR
jgi:BASS family bile acid:Na+ symporter